MLFKSDNADYIRFLKDEKFIEWNYYPTEELNLFWEEHLLQNPEDKDSMIIASNYLQKINLSSYRIPVEKKKAALKRLERSLDNYNRKQKMRSFAYAAAACAAILIMSVFYIQRNKVQTNEELIVSADYIVGSELESEDILFITSNKTVSYQNNVDIQIENGNTAQITSGDKKTEEISFDQKSMNKLIVPYGKRSKIELTDGTKIWLNSGSTLDFPSNFTEDIREVFVTGEMYIEVAPDKNKTFVVHTSDYDVKVYGTKFNVSTYSGSRSSVVLIEGSVALKTNNSELKISPNEQAISLGDGTFQTQKVDVSPIISWKDGYLTFEDTPLTDVLKQIERYYNLSFNYESEVSLKGLTCTGKIILSENLDNTMTALSLISDTKFKKEDKLIFIYK